MKNKARTVQSILEMAENRAYTPSSWALTRRRHDTQTSSG